MYNFLYAILTNPDIAKSPTKITIRYGLNGLSEESLVTAIAKITVPPIRNKDDTIQKSFFIIVYISGKGKGSQRITSTLIPANEYEQKALVAQSLAYARLLIATFFIQLQS